MITNSPPEVKSGPINRAILLPPAMPPPAASTSHHPASQCRPSGGEARTHVRLAPKGQCRPRRRGPLRRISPPQRRKKSHPIQIEPNSREFGSFFRGSASEKTPLAQRSVRKPTSPQTGGLECAQRSAGLHRPAFQAGRGTLTWHEMPAGISASLKIWGRPRRRRCSR